MAPNTEDIITVNKQSVGSINVAAVVVLYYPDDQVYNNIMSYLHQVDLVIVVDNSDDPSVELIVALTTNEKVVCLVNGSNLGIAAALNLGAREAMSRGYNYLLTMDQDSCASQGMVEVLKGYFLKEGNISLAIASPFHLTVIDEVPDTNSGFFKEVDTVWTSGNLLDLSAYKAVGPFMEDLFIDFVDHEYCLRLRLQGYRIIQSYSTILHHTIGNHLTKKRILSISLITSHHPPMRRYYITRNRFWVRNRYNEFKDFCQTDRKRFFAELVNILLFEDQKIEKYKMVIRGYRDYRRGIMGKFKMNSTPQDKRSNV